MAQPICPFCLGRHDLTLRECTKTEAESNSPKKEEIPSLYIDKYDQVSPIFLVTIGFSKHGKTTYQAALTWMLEKLNRVFKGATYQTLDQYTFNWIKNVREDAKRGRVPAKTGMSVPRPALLHMYNLPLFGSRCLVLYDTPGEVFTDLSIIKHTGYLQSLNAVRNLWFIISLKDLEESPEQNIHDLLNVYLTGMVQMGWSLKGRNLIVIYTKADAVIDRRDATLPLEIEHYLKNDPFRGLTISDNASAPSSIDLEAYLAQMQEISSKLKEYTRQEINGGGAFINLAENIYDLGLHFTITSALGSSPNDQGGMDVETDRYRVLDPFFWALDLNQLEVPHPISLILDATSSDTGAADGSAGSALVYQLPLDKLEQILSEQGEVMTFLLGQSRPASQRGQTPPTKAPRSPRPRLIGPILEQPQFGKHYIVITTGPIQDLADFNSREWQDRLLLVSLGEEEVQNWPNQIVLRSNDSVATVYHAFKQMLTE
jgi:hypothetical protein